MKTLVKSLVVIGMILSAVPFVRGAPAGTATADNLPLYCVIYLSGGSDPNRYPVTYLNDVPAGGWTAEYKTSRLVLRRVKAGTFMMGGRSADYSGASNSGLHQVTLTKDYWIGVFEVTQTQWNLVMGSNPSGYANTSYDYYRPVERVSYGMIRGSSSGAGWPGNDEVDASSFIGKLRSKVPDLKFDLPTEAQWEYACRAGTTTALNSGKNLTDANACPNVAEVGRYRSNGGSNSFPNCTTSNGTAKVGSYEPNAWGLYDMHGNVFEWCLDWYGSHTSSAVTNPVGAASGYYRTPRGGDFDCDATAIRSAYRDLWQPSTKRGSGYGLRLAAVPSVP